MKRPIIHEMFYMNTKHLIFVRNDSCIGLETISMFMKRLTTIFDKL